VPKAVIDERRRQGLVLGRTARRRATAEGVEIVPTVEHVYSDESITVA